MSELSNEVLGYLESIEGFVLKEAPGFVRQYIRWGITVNIIVASIGLVLLGLAAFFYGKVYKDDLDWLTAAIPTTLVGSCMLIGGVVAIVKASAFPYIYLVDKLL